VVARVFFIDSTPCCFTFPGPPRWATTAPNEPTLGLKVCWPQITLS